MQTPAHAALGDLLSYASAEPVPPGTLVRVPLGKREVLGVVWNEPVSLLGAEPGMALKPVGAALAGPGGPPAAPPRPGRGGGFKK
ncbi:hypothetical protein [Variovorax sp. Varisp62]|uniref:hypothetical protein n=1 Tax=Variovorax sp. Varisp62 TaxID=3243049 RepID=UPI0039B5ED50